MCPSVLTGGERGGRGRAAELGGVGAETTPPSNHQDSRGKIDGANKTWGSATSPMYLYFAFARNGDYRLRSITRVLVAVRAWQGRTFAGFVEVQGEGIVGNRVLVQPSVGILIGRVAEYIIYLSRLARVTLRK